jgi:hypothetical protein
MAVARKLMALKLRYWCLAASGLSLLLLVGRIPKTLHAVDYFSADNAIVGLMALHISQGIHLPLYFYGQGYMGAGEAYLLALFFSIFGPSIQVMTLLNTGLYLIALLLNSILIRRFAGGGLAGMSLLLAALAPPFFTDVTLFSLGGYTAIMILGAAFWLVWTRLFILSEYVANHQYFKRFILLAILSGLGFWTWSLIWLFILPCALYHLIAIAPGLNEMAKRDDRQAKSRLQWALTIMKAVGLIYALYALAVIIMGKSLDLDLPGGLVFQPALISQQLRICPSVWPYSCLAMWRQGC